MMISHRTLILTGVVAGILVGIASVASVVMRRGAEQTNARATPEIARGRLAPDEVAVEEARWRKDILTRGAHAAYEAFKETHRDLPGSDQHALAHLFGEILYETAGTAGAGVCDNDRGFGCFHGLFTKPIRERGIEAIREFAVFCIERYGASASGCAHGIGHVVTYEKRYDIFAALETCRTLPTFDPHEGCVSGAFMEYNTRGMLLGESATPGLRPWHTADPYAPCPASPADLQENCYYTLTEWWASIHRQDFAAVGELCANLPGKSMQLLHACFRGAGNTAAWQAEYDVQETLGFCKHMPSAEAINLCIVEAAQAFFGNVPTRDRAEAVCAGLSPIATHDCPPHIRGASPSR